MPAEHRRGSGRRRRRELRCERRRGRRPGRDQPPPTTTTAPTTTPTTTTGGGAKGDAAAGKQVFDDGRLRQVSHAGGRRLDRAQSGPNLDEAKPDAALVTDRVTNGQGRDAAVQGQLDAKQIADVAAYVSSVAGT